MPYYAIYCEDVKDNNLEKRRSVRPAHLQRLEDLNQQGNLLTAGPMPLTDGDNVAITGIFGSLIIAQFHDLHAAKAWAAADPYVTAGIFARVTVHPFMPGSF